MTTIPRDHNDMTQQPQYDTTITIQVQHATESLNGFLLLTTAISCATNEPKRCSMLFGPQVRLCFGFLCSIFYVIFSDFTILLTTHHYHPLHHQMMGRHEGWWLMRNDEQAQKDPGISLFWIFILNVFQVLLRSWRCTTPLHHQITADDGQAGPPRVHEGWWLMRDDSWARWASFGPRYALFEFLCSILIFQVLLCSW